jgi:PHP family Zn ribbon phosphoesterase
VHNLVYAPDFEVAARIATRLARIGNIEADGRPILGLDARDLLELTLEASPDAFLVPAHVWTPWFSALGEKSGFDSLDECFRDLAGHVFAAETGLSSDPAMN